MELAIEILKREIAQRELAQKHNHLRKSEVQLELDSLNKAVKMLLDTINYIPQKGDMFEWWGDKYWCIESGILSGVVTPIGETFCVRGFSWKIGGEKSKFVRKATEEEFEKLFGKL